MLGLTPVTLLKNLEKDECLYIYANADRDKESGFRDICIVATNKRLIIATGEKITQKTFRGFVNRAKLPEFKDEKDYSNYEIVSYPLDEVDSLEVINLVSGGRLTYIKNEKRRLHK